MTYKVVNMVASTRITENIDLNEVSEILGIEYEQEQFPGMVYRVESPKVCLLLFRSGRCVAAGAKNINHVHEAVKILHDDLIANEFELWPFDSIDIILQNIVVTHNIGVKLDLERLVISLPFEYSEYEPEQFPGLIYHIKDPNVVFLIFASGKCVISGSKNFEDIEAAIVKLNVQLEEILEFVTVDA
jgi:transcription initiation factor TFIID TATA-box-binding protein